MKTKLLLFFAVVTGAAMAQSPVTSYYGTNDAVFTIVAPTGVNHTPSGANATWNFNNLLEIGQSVDSQTAPTATELIAFPGTTAVVTTTSVYADNTSAQFKIFSKAPANALSITGIDNSELTLTYSTNNALLGTFPLNFGYTFTDNVAGNYDNGAYEGSFTGNIVTSVDAYGTLTANSNPVAVTRMKTVQNLSLNYGIFPNIGTVVVTTYSYYASSLGAGVPAFRSTVTAVNVPLLSINQTVTQNEAFAAFLLGTESHTPLSQKMVLAPNPVQGQLNVLLEGSKIENLSITDLTGKMVALQRATNSIDVSNLQSGIYFVKATTAEGIATKKFIKQ